MSRNKSNRRTFLQRGLAVGAGVAITRMSASSYARTLGANERINTGLVGCGARGRYLAGHSVAPADGNTMLIALCDIWKARLSMAADEMAPLMGAKPKTYEDYHRFLDDRDLDAVFISTPDHQHAGMTVDAVQAGKHVYVEKPIIGLHSDMPILNKYLDTIKASKMVVQNGTQGVSCGAADAIKAYIADNKLGKLFRIESTETGYKPYWFGYKGPESEADTNWRAWLYNREYRPFDAHLHAKWMGYKEITSGTIGGWMAHFINTVHYVTGCDFPISATAWGGRYASTNDPKCTAPDQTFCLLEYPEGFHTQFTSHFGSEIGNESTVFMFERGSIRTKFGHALGNPVASGEGTKSQMTPTKLLDSEPGLAPVAHVKNWLHCIRNGGQPNAGVDYGYKQGVAIAMGDLAWDLGCKVTFDKQKREVSKA